MKEWMISITAACFLLSVAGLFLSEGKTKKYLSGILRVIIIFFVFAPILTLFTEKNILGDNERPTETTFMISDQTELFVQLCEKELNKKGISCTVKVTEEEGKITYVDIYTDESVITTKDGNIYKNSKTVISTVEKYLAVEREQIRVWGK